jgi:hypothetical protein
MVAIDVATRDEVVVPRENVDHGPGRLGDAAGPERVTKHPRMPAPHTRRDIERDPVLPYPHPNAGRGLRGSKGAFGLSHAAAP